MRAPRFIFLLFFLYIPKIGQGQDTKVELDTVYRKGSLSGSIGSRIRQNDQANKENLSRIKDYPELDKFIKKALLVPIPENKNLETDPWLDPRLRFVRPHTARFLNHFGDSLQKKFGKPIQVNSAVRTVLYQKELIMINSNADSSDGQTASSHLTGSTVDIAKKKMSRAELRWIRAYLIALELEDQIEATEENVQAVFHVMVYKNYSSEKRTEKAPD